VGSPITECNQKGCENPAAFRFTWPGKDEAGICAIHAVKMQGITRAMGLYVQTIPLTVDDYIRPAPPADPEANDAR
jgi:hypothetical protein